MATMPGDQAASDVNRELTGLLSAIGGSLGFTVVTEYPVRGGRLDVVWAWRPPVPIPGLDVQLPVVGFEIESSWRTRKHVKGDLLNLQDAGVALGVIVLAGESGKDDSLRRFAVQLVDRPGPNMLIWSADDVRALGKGSSDMPDTAKFLGRSTAKGSGVDTGTVLAAAGRVKASALATASHAGKYLALYRWLRSQERASVIARFSDVEEVLGFPLPDSCRHHTPHWYSYEGSAVARAIVDAGWKATEVNLRSQTVTFVRVE
jgi:hypothetical protein